MLRSRIRVLLVVISRLVRAHDGQVVRAAEKMHRVLDCVQREKPLLCYFVSRMRCSLDLQSSLIKITVSAKDVLS